MQCPGCGKTIPNHVLYCAYCGTTVHQPPLTHVPPPASPRSHIGRWFVAGGALLAVALVTVCLFAVLGGALGSGNIPTPAPPAPAPPTATPYQGSLPLTITDQDGKTMVLVPAGPFLMGSTDADSAADSDEKPQHEVYLDAYYIDKTEVTNAEFCRFLNEQGNQEEGGVTWLEIDSGDCLIERSGSQFVPKAGYADHPVIMVSWYGAQAYAAWAGKRLPTEAEWEKAARGTDGRIYPWGNEWDSDKCNSGERGLGKTTAVGSYPAGASPYGALDLAGNVWEWCADWYASDYYRNSPASNPAGPDSGESRVLRGGSWNHRRDWGRAADRAGTLPHYRSDRYGGFRCVVSPTSTVAPTRQPTLTSPPPTLINDFRPFWCVI